jgi:hypothetical protein
MSGHIPQAGPRPRNSGQVLQFRTTITPTPTSAIE